MRYFFLLLLLSFQYVYGQITPFQPSMVAVADIPLPIGFERVFIERGSFAAYLRGLPLRKQNTVYLYNGALKPDQSFHYAVIDISTGTRDLQQCADVVMRLRAEYFYSRKQYDSIVFSSSAATYRYPAANPSRESFLRFMEKVFAYCGTFSLDRQLKKIPGITSMQIGDVFIKGGAPGHAEMVVDMAINKRTGQKIYLLAEGYMPAQDTHIVLNPASDTLGPWYLLTADKKIVTPTWVFNSDQLKRW